MSVCLFAYKRDMSNELYLSLQRRLSSSNPTILVLAENGALDMTDENVTVLGASLSATEGNILRQAEVFFQKDLSVNPVYWQTRCSGKVFVCAINDMRLARGKALPIQLGDYIDIGLLRFKVVTADEATPLRQVVPEHEGSDPLTSFDLGRLADTQKWKATDSENDPFDIVGVHVPYLDEAQPLDLSAAQILPSSTHSMPLDKPAEEEDVLRRLADEYAQVLLNPDLLHQFHGDETVTEREDLAVSHLDTTHQGQQWGQDESLEDFILGKMTIKEVLDGLEIDDFQELKVTEPSEEVLALFAQGVVPKRAERLPARTRHDHHRINLDSHYQPEESSNTIEAPKTDFVP